MSRVWGGTAFAKRSAAMKAPVGLLSGSAVCDSRWRGVAPTSATPTRSLRKCRRIAEVKSRMDRTFSRIENLWPRDGSCPLPLRSKPFLGNCFRIVKTQKISRGDSAHVMGSPFDLNEVPAPVCAAALTESRYHVRSAHEIFKVQLPKRKIPPTQHSDGFCRVNRRQNESGVLRGGKFFRGLFLTEVVGLTVITNHFLWLCSK